LSVDPDPPGVTPLSTAALPGSPSLRRGVYAVVLAVASRFLLDLSWLQVAAVVATVALAESAEIGRGIPAVDGRHLRGVLGVGLAGLGALAVVGTSGPLVGEFLVAVGVWVALDALYALRAGIRPAPNREDDDAGEVLLTLQVGHLVAEELADGPKTVPELATACDLTESRVRDVLDRHRRAGVVSRDGDRWILEESRVGPWAFVRDNARRAAVRVARPFRLFVPS
jgi:hypothetical protein